MKQSGSRLSHWSSRVGLLVSAAVLGAASLSASACKPGGVGDPCVPEDEYVREFSGYQVTEVNVESRSFQCETRVCLVNHFQGRVTCPYGQTEDDIAAGASDKRCRIPNTEKDYISAVVPAQRLQRRADDAVYCSCRCANADGKTDDGAKYCECPSGFSCKQLIDDLSLGSKQLAGGYCVRNGTNYDEKSVGSGECSRDAKEGEDAFCGAAHPF
jgi:hypothetical protein